MRVKKIVRNIALILLVLTGLGLIGLELLAQSYREKAGSYFRTQFTSKSDLVLQPFVTSVSIWRHFPRVTFTFDNLALVDTNSVSPLQVVAIKRAEVVIPLTQLNFRKIRISRVNLQDMVFHQRVDSLGNKSGLRFQQEVKADTSGNKLSFVIKKLVITNGQYISENFYKKGATSIHLSETDLNVQRLGKELTINGLIKGKINYISNNKLRLYKNEPFVLNGNYLLNAEKNIGYITKTEVLLHGNTLKITGNHSRLTSGQGARLNIIFAGYQPLIYLFQQLIPPSALPVLDKIKSSSKIYLVCKLQGNSGPKLRPRSIINFKLTNGEVYVPGSHSVIKGVQLAGSLDNGAKHGLKTSRLLISKASAYVGTGFLHMNFSLTNFLKPAFTFQANGRIDLITMARLFPLPISQVNQGILTGNINLKGDFNDSITYKQQNFTGKGLIQLKNAAFRPQGLSVMCRQVNGVFRLSENNLMLEQLNGKMANQPFRIAASIQNYVPYLFGQPGNIQAKASIQAAQFKSAWLDGNVFASVDANPKTNAELILPASYKNNSANKLTYTLVKQERLLQTKNRARQKQLVSAQTNQLVQSLLTTASSQVNVSIGELMLTNEELIRKFAFQINQKGQQVALTNMQFYTTEGGKATASGGFSVTKAGIRNPQLRVKLNYDFLNLQTFMQHIANLKQSAPKSDKPLTARQKKQIEKFKDNNYWVQLQVNARKVQYNYLNGTDLAIQANLNNYRARLTQLDLKAFGGQISSQGVIYLDEPTATYPVRLQAKVSDIDLQQLLAVANQMKLDLLSPENVKGTASCNLAVLTFLDQTFVPSLDQTVAFAKANFKNMELIEVTPIQSALSFLRKERTNHLYFEDVTTRFILQNNQFITPKLQLNSNLTDFELSGRYVMGGGAKLNMDINVLNVLFGNNKRRIERIQADSTAAKNDQNKQHLQLIRDQNKYKVRLHNKKDRADNAQILKEEFESIIRHHQIDTVFTATNNISLK